MKTCIYWPEFLGPLGKQADFWALVNLLMESVTTSDLELFVDTEPARPALTRLFNEIRKGHVNRVVIRSLSDLCLTPEEVMRFAVEVSLKGVKVEQIFSLLPSALVRTHPELVGRYRHRQRIAKVLRMREAGLTIMEIASMVRASPQQVYRILSKVGPPHGFCVGPGSVPTTRFPRRVGFERVEVTPFTRRNRGNHGS